MIFSTSTRDTKEFTICPAYGLPVVDRCGFDITNSGGEGLEVLVLGNSRCDHVVKCADIQIAKVVAII